MELLTSFSLVNAARTTAAVVLTAVASLGLNVTSPAAVAADGGDLWTLSNVFGGTGDVSCYYGVAGDGLVAGDWNGDGVESPGVFRGGAWALSNVCGGTGDYILNFGQAGDIPFVGDWDGNGTDTPGVFRNGHWYLSNSFSGSVDYSFDYGIPSDVPVVGDWNGDGRTTVGIFRNSDWHITDALGGAPGYVFNYGVPGDVPVVGDWNGDGRETPGIYRGANWALSDVFGGTGDHNFVYGVASDLPIVGDWDGNGSSTPGVVRTSSDTAPAPAAEGLNVDAEVGDVTVVNSTTGPLAGRVSAGGGGFTCVKNPGATSSLRAHTPIKVDESTGEWETHWVIHPYSVPNARLVMGSYTTQFQMCAIGGSQNKTWHRMAHAGIALSINNANNMRLGSKWGTSVDAGTISATLGMQLTAGVASISGSMPITNGGNFKGSVGSGAKCGAIGRDAGNQVNGSWDFTYPGLGTADFKGNVVQALYEFPVANKTRFQIYWEPCRGRRYF